METMKWGSAVRKERDLPSNDTGIEPRGWAVLCEVYEPPKKGLIELPDMVKERMVTLETEVIVVAVGSEAWKGESQPRAFPGEHVMIARFAGAIVKSPLNGKSYRMVRDTDIFAALSHMEEELDGH